MWDIGCNIGFFSIFAAMANDIKVFAFDAMANNIAGLVKNLKLNGMEDRVTPLCLPLTSKTGFYPLQIPAQAFETGGSGAELFSPSRPKTYDTPQTLYLNSLAYALDDLTEQAGLPIPNHIKMDVDGVEDMVIAGSMKTLENSKVRSLMFEISADLYDEVLLKLSGLGFNHDKRVSTDEGIPIIDGSSGTNNFFSRSNQ